MQGSLVAASTLSYWCFAPGLSMRQLQSMQVHSIVLTSGTLSPLDSFAHELQLPFRITLENPHVVDESQVCTHLDFEAQAANVSCLLRATAFAKTWPATCL